MSFKFLYLALAAGIAFLPMNAQAETIIFSEDFGPVTLPSRW